MEGMRPHKHVRGNFRLLNPLRNLGFGDALCFFLAGDALGGVGIKGLYLPAIQDLERALFNARRMGGECKRPERTFRTVNSHDDRARCCGFGFQIIAQGMVDVFSDSVFLIVAHSHHGDWHVGMLSYG